MRRPAKDFNVDAVGPARDRPFRQTIILALEAAEKSDAAAVGKLLKGCDGDQRVALAAHVLEKAVGLGNTQLAALCLDSGIDVAGENLHVPYIMDMALNLRQWDMALFLKSRGAAVDFYHAVNSAHVADYAPLAALEALGREDLAAETLLPDGDLQGVLFGIYETASRTGRVELIDWMCRHARVNTRTGDAIFDRACRYDPELLKALRRNGIWSDTDAQEGTPLLTALRRDRKATVKALLDGGADPEKPGHGGVSPLVYAALNGQSASVRLLLAAGADVHAGNALALQQARALYPLAPESIFFLGHALGLARAGAQEKFRARFGHDYRAADLALPLAEGKGNGFLLAAKAGLFGEVVEKIISSGDAIAAEDLLLKDDTATHALGILLSDEIQAERAADHRLYRQPQAGMRALLDAQDAGWTAETKEKMLKALELAGVAARQKQLKSGSGKFRL